MKIHEYQAKELLKTVGIPTNDGLVANNFAEAQAAVKKIGLPCVLKAQVLVGGRGKAGGVKLCKTPQELETHFKNIQNLTIKGYPVKKILMAQAIDIKSEFYAAATIDYGKNDIVLIVSTEGGVDIEETAQKNPEKIHKFYLGGKKIIDQKAWRPFIEKVFANKAHQEKVTGIFQLLVDLVYTYDCTLAEINPLVIDGKGNWCAADAKMIFDDNALFRHEELLSLHDPVYEDLDEKKAKECGLSFVKLDGNIGCIVNGAGLAMATTDVIKMTGGEPANFLDVGGSSNPQKVLDALKIILKNPKTKAILINIFGGITRCDDIAKGILEAKKNINIKVPLVIRLTGTNEKEAIELLSKEKMKIYSSMREAVKEVVNLAKK